MADRDSDDIQPSHARLSDNLDAEIRGLLTPRFADRPPVEREGLPPGYRMRADSHYVDQLSARAPDVPMRFVAIDDIDAVDPGPPVDEALHSLVRSVADHGILQPLLVRRDGTRYRLIAGRKRLAAARAASLSRVPCLVHSVDPEQAEALARASEVRGAAPVTAAASLPALPVPDVAEAIASIQSAAGLLSADASPMVRRVAIDLVRAASWRAAWQMSAAAILNGSHRWTSRSQLIGHALDAVRDGCAVDARLRGIEVKLHLADWNLAAAFDRHAFHAAASGVVIALTALATGEEPRHLTLSAERASAGAAMVELSLEPLIVDPRAIDRFFDPAWIDRPDGRVAATGAHVARAVAERHAGTAEFRATDRGAAVRLTLREL